MKLTWKTCLLVGSSIFLLFLAIYYWPQFVSFAALLLSAAFPLLMGAVIAYLVNILMNFYERHFLPKSKSKLIKNTRRPICLVGAYVTLVGIVVAVLVLIIPQLTSCIKLLLEKLPGAMKFCVNILDEYHLVPEDILATLTAIDWQSRIQGLTNTILSGVTNVMGTVISMVSSVISGFVTAFLSIIFSIYLLLEKDNLLRQIKKVCKHYLPDKIVDKSGYVISVLNDCFHRYIVGQCTEAVVLGLLCFLGMALLRLPYSGMIGALVAVTALIPVAGAYIGTIVGAFMIFTVSPVQALIFIVFLMILQQIEGNLIYPKVVGDSIGLPGIWVLAAVTIGGGVLGVLGMLLGVPLAAAVYRLIKEDVNK